MSKIVTIDCFPECVPNYSSKHTLVAIDVIRATTTAVTAVACGRQCFPAPSLTDAQTLAFQMHDPLLAGEINGNIPQGFEINNSPTELENRHDLQRPLILLSTSGTRLICQASDTQDIYIACLRNYAALADYLVRHHSNVVLIGAGSRNEFRQEDQLCCAWIGRRLLQAGFVAHDIRTRSIIGRWGREPVETILSGASAEYLRRSNQLEDLNFILASVNDLNAVYRYERKQIIKQD